MAVLDHQRDRALTRSAAERSALLEMVIRTIRSNAARCAAPTSLGIPPSPGLSPSTFLAWIDDEPAPPARPNPPPARGAIQGPMRRVQEWDLARINLEAAVCFGRSAERVAKWRRGPGVADGATPSLDMLSGLVHARTLPTLTSSRADHWWLLKRARYMTVVEVARAFGLADDNPLTVALRAVKCPTTAVELAGRGIHASVARLILRWLDSRGHIPARPTYASSCSGVDFFAAALHAFRGGAFTYVHAAECRPDARSVLRRAWGLAESAIHADARDPAASAAPCVDLYVASPDCTHFSRRRHGKTSASIADGAQQVAATLGFVIAGRARVVVVENVAEPDGVGAINTVLRGAPYTWHYQRLDALEHAGQPVSREREFWVGLRR
jgi:hypothetical protein